MTTLTGLPDTDALILMRLPYYSLLAACNTNKYLNAICQSSHFWQQKVVTDFGPDALQYLSPNETPRQLYDSLTRVYPLSAVSFVSTTEVAVDIFKTIAAHHFNIRALFQGDVGNGLMKVVIVPGSGYELPFPGTQTENDIAIITNRLRELNVNHYVVKRMIIVNQTGPGTWGEIIDRFAKHQLRLPERYADESGGLILDFPDFEKARQIFS